jgi:MinD-like ATPase involved in chromosome partitioning or flagellar assembly
MTIQQLLDVCREFYADLDVAYIHPSLYVFCISPEFEEVDEEARLKKFLVRTGVAPQELERLINAAIISLYFVTQEERDSSYAFIEKCPGAQHWLPLLDKHSTVTTTPAQAGPIPALHFYGFKGGQARTTVLAMLAKDLARDGYNVLVVDADIEAPSLDHMFDTGVPNIESTLMGLCGWSEELLPLPAWVSPNHTGRIDIVPCRPRGEEFDMDFAAFGLRVSLDIATLRKAIEKIKSFVLDAQGHPKYDLVIFDHRTGIASSVLPIIRSWRGATVVSVRPDGLSSQALGAFAALFAQNPETPGAYVCYSVDQEDSKAAILSRHGEEIEKLMEELAIGLARGAEESDPLPISALQRYWVNWGYDKQFVGKLSPDFEKLSSENQSSIRQLREVLSFSNPIKEERGGFAFNDERTPSGAQDDGWFIETNEIARLFSASSPVNYIIGRKGTGKTRLHREMVARTIAEPIFTSADFEGGGIQSLSSQYDELLNACEGDFKRFWWSLLAISLRVSNTTNVPEFESSLREFCAKPVDERVEIAQSFNVAACLTKTERIFLIDGIETAVPAAKLRSFIEELLRFMLTLQSDSRFRPFVQARLFLRTDLLKAAAQNIEQQVNQRVVELRWDSDGIFNYVLGRIERLSWFNENFAETSLEIRENLPLIRAGKLPTQKYEELLLEIFPGKLRRKNLQTLTFLETYFSDASGKIDDGASFYPRLFDAFLVEISSQAQSMTARGEPTLENGRVLHTIVLDAHAKASVQFVHEVKQELYVLLNLSNEDVENRQYVDTLIEAFEGRPTPFQQDILIDSLATRLPVSAPLLRNALKQMTDIGIFERHPKNPGELRAGRLYKSALRMKYVR